MKGSTRQEIGHGTGTQETYILLLPLALTCRMTFGKSLQLPVPLFPSYLSYNIWGQELPLTACTA